MSHIVGETPMEFFREALQEALQREGVTVDVTSEYYLVKLLVSQIDEGFHPDETLGDRFAIAIHAKPIDRMQIFRAVGDRALINCGLWWEHQYRPRRPSYAQYHMQLGKVAYRGVGGEPFDEIAEKFEGLVDALIRFGTKASLATARDILRLYTLWEETRSAHAASALAERGVYVVRGSSPTPS